MNLRYVIIAQNLIDNIDAPDVLTERENGLDVRLCRNIAFTVLIAADTNIGNGRLITDEFFHFSQLHLLGTPSSLRRRKEVSAGFEEMMERCRFRTAFGGSQYLDSSEVRIKTGYEQFCLSQLAPSIRIIVLDFEIRVLILHVDGEGCAILAARYSKYMSYHSINS